MKTNFTLPKDSVHSVKVGLYSKIFKTFLSLTLLLSIFTAGCSKDNFEAVQGDCPVVVSTDPLDKAVDVVLNKTVSITFNTDMDSTTINSGTFSIQQGATVIAGKIAPTASAKTYTFTPATPLSPYLVYTGTVTTGAKDTFRTSMTDNYTWTFTTIPLITISSTPTAGGTTTGAGQFAQGSTATVTAIPNPGYVFVNWTVAGTPVSTSSSFQFIVNGNKTLVANFMQVLAGQFAVVLSSNPVAGGTNVGSGAYASGTTVTVTATPNAGYTFLNWTDNGIVVSTSSNYLFVILANRTLIAHYVTNGAGGVGPAPINLGSAGDFATLTKAGISTTGVTLITGDIGVSPSAATSITGFGLIMDTNGQSAHTPIVVGKVYASDYAAPTPAKMTTAVSDMETAFTAGNALVTPAPIVGLYSGDISGRTLTAGLYKWSTGVLITNAGVTLSGGPNDVWVFQIAQDLTVNNSANITLLGGAQAKNIFWVVSGQATLGTNTNFSGNILSKTLISLNTGAKVTGRLLAQTAVTLNTSIVIQP